MAVFPLRNIGTLYPCDAKVCPKIQGDINTSCSVCGKQSADKKRNRKVVKGMVYVMKCPHCKGKAHSTDHSKPYECESCNWSSDQYPPKKEKSVNSRKWFKSVMYLDKREEWVEKALGFSTTHSKNTPYVSSKTRTIKTPVGDFRVHQVRDVDSSGKAGKGPSFRVYAHSKGEGREPITSVATGHAAGKQVGRKLLQRIGASTKKSIRDFI